MTSSIVSVFNSSRLLASSDWHRAVRSLSTWCLVISAVTISLASVVRAQDSEMLPELIGEITWDESILSPSQFAGFEMGDRHWQHHQVVSYFHYLADRSEFAQWEAYALSHQQRELGCLTITSPDNWNRIDAIQAAHRQLTDPETSSFVDVESLPAIVLMGYGVHGDEPSATHAALSVAYLLVAGRGEWIDRVREQLVVRVDPCLNPDGFERFSSWSNEYLGSQPNDDPWHREHRQDWPGGRVNAYWFDLNRDWLPLVHPESRGRLFEYHRWRPVLLLDYHEMGTDSTYFFQPGVPSRTNPFAPKSTFELTRKLAEYHAQALERIGTRFFTEERFDDFYPGKGSTYPDLKGSVGILFEQSSARGVVQRGSQGLRSLRSTVRNQVATSCSSLKGAIDLRRELLEHVRASYLEARAEAQEQPIAAYALSAAGDSQRLKRFAELLAQHEIKSQVLTTATEVPAVDGSAVALEAGTLIVDARQRESRLLRAIFDRATSFEENAFYDVSAWALPLAFGLEQRELAQLPSSSELTSEFTEAEVGVDEGEAVAFVLDWSQDGASQELVRVMRSGLQVQVAAEAFVAQTPAGERRFEPGAIAVFGALNEESGEVEIEALRDVLKAATSARWTAITSGLTREGIDLGSGSWLPLPAARIAVVIGEGIDRYSAGAIWHRYDKRLGAQVTLLESNELIAALNATVTTPWTTIVISGGAVSGWGAAEKEAIAAWLSRGGTLVTLGDANAWTAAQGWVSLTARPPRSAARRPFAEAADDAALERIAGAIVMAELDLTHPLAWGCRQSQVPLFRDHTTYLAVGSSPYGTPGVYAEEPVAAGYVSNANRGALKTSASIVVVAQGRGRIVAFGDQPAYRGFFDGSSRLLDNAVLLGPVIVQP